MTLYKVRFLASVAALNAATLLLVLNAFSPIRFPGTVGPVYKVQAAPALPVLPERIIISGKPVRITIERLGINLLVSDGAYNEADGSWTLTENQAHFATITTPANDFQGNTLVYGHNNKLVFSKLSQIAAGDQVRVHTDNGHIFLYSFKNSATLQPDDVSIFEYKGEPKLTLQTCSGDWYEFRQLFEFSLDKVEQ